MQSDAVRDAMRRLIKGGWSTDPDPGPAQPSRFRSIASPRDVMLMMIGAEWDDGFVPTLHDAFTMQGGVSFDNVCISGDSVASATTRVSRTQLVVQRAMWFPPLGWVVRTLRQLGPEAPRAAPLVFESAERNAAIAFLVEAALFERQPNGALALVSRATVCTEVARAPRDAETPRVSVRRDCVAVWRREERRPLPKPAAPPPRPRGPRDPAYEGRVRRYRRDKAAWSADVELRARGERVWRWEPTFAQIVNGGQPLDRHLWTAGDAAPEPAVPPRALAPLLPPRCRRACRRA
jgi:hypothetical protein